MKSVIAIAAGGALGAVGRYWVYNLVHGVFGRGFPYGTLTVNVVGSFAIGFAYVWLFDRMDVEVQWRAFAIVGFLGAFTTFSAFSLETMNLLAQGLVGRSLANIGLNIFVCLLAVWAGTQLGRWLA